jgi:hypothetical protein
MRCLALGIPAALLLGAAPPPAAVEQVPAGELSLEWTVQTRVDGKLGGYMLHELACAKGRCDLKVIRLSDCTGGLAVFKALQYSTADGLEAVAHPDGLSLEYRDGRRAYQQRLTYAVSPFVRSDALKKVSGVVVEEAADGKSRSSELLPLSGAGGLALVRFGCPLALPALPQN